MNRQRFLRLWILWSAVYLLLAVVGPNGLIPVPSWPVLSQHLIQARAWLGMDIVIPGDAGGPDRVVTVHPRLDVTPYFEHQVVRDPRERSQISNLAVAIPGPGGLTPAQDIRGIEDDPDLFELARCFVGFPPGPSYFLLPLVFLFRGALATQWLGALLGGLAVAAVDRLLGRWLGIFGLDDGRPGLDVLSVLAGAGTLLIWLAPDGGTFLFAQTVGVTFLTLALVGVSSGRRFSAGLAFGIAVCARPAMVGAVPILLGLHSLRERTHPTGLRHAVGSGSVVRGLSSVVPLAIGPALFGALTLALNTLRFGSWSDFGYRFMIVPAFLKQRLAETGQLSWTYVAGNLRWVGLQGPAIVRNEAGELVFPFLASDPHGMGLIWVTPAVLAAAVAWWARGRHEGRLLFSAWVSLILCCLPGLMYYNSGWVQWGGRFLMDAWPLWLMLAALGLRRLPRPLSVTLIILSVVSNLWAALLVALRVWPGCCS